MILGKQLKNKINYTIGNFIEMVDYSLNDRVNDLLLEKLTVTTFNSVNISVWAILVKNTLNCSGKLNVLVKNRISDLIWSSIVITYVRIENKYEYE
jgi:hypothetical protein